MAGTRVFLTNFPQGFQTDVGLRNVPTILTSSGRNIWVDSNGAGTGSNAQRRGTFQRPYATVKQALAAAQSYDTIWVKSGHTETIGVVGGWTIGSATLVGINVIGIGKGDDRPQITFSAVASSIAIAGAGCGIINLVGIAGTQAGITNAVNVTGAGCNVDMEWRNTTLTTAEALIAVLAAATAKNLFVNLRWRGNAGDTIAVTAVRLVGVVGARINVDFYGAATTAVVEFKTTACKDVVVTGSVNNATSGNASTGIIVDTQGSSSYGAKIDVYNLTSVAQVYYGKIAV